MWSVRAENRVETRRSMTCARSSAATGCSRSRGVVAERFMTGAAALETAALFDSGSYGGSIARLSRATTLPNWAISAHRAASSTGQKPLKASRGRPNGPAAIAHPPGGRSAVAKGNELLLESVGGGSASFPCPPNHLLRCPLDASSQLMRAHRAAPVPMPGPESGNTGPEAVLSRHQLVKLQVPGMSPGAFRGIVTL
jgi:hypothetical protein